MGQKDCTYSLVKKPCPRKRFPCSRCGAKIVNAGLQWEISVPKYKQWHYIDPETMTIHDSASASPAVMALGDALANIDPETGEQSPCKFGGSDVLEQARILSGTTPDDYGDLVADFERDRFIGDGNSSPWVQFKREYSAIVDWVQSEEEYGVLIAPGSWRVTLKITQAALRYVGVSPANKFGNYAGGGMYGDRVTIYVADLAGAPYNHSDGDLSPSLGIYDPLIITQEYFALSQFECPALGDAYRWARDVPTLPPISSISGYTINTLPAGYEWPDLVATHDAGGNPTVFHGPFFPPGFDSIDDYYAPPYIDVRHTKK